MITRATRASAPPVLHYRPDKNSLTLRRWLKEEGTNRYALKNWLEDIGSEADVAGLLSSAEYRSLRETAVEYFDMG